MVKAMKTLAVFSEDGEVIETLKFSDTDVTLTVRGVGVVIANALTPSDDIWNLAARAAAVRSRRTSDDASPAQRIQSNVVRLLGGQGREMAPRRIPGETDLEFLKRLAASGERTRANADVSDVWQLIQNAGESDDDYAIRALALGCNDDYRRRIQRRLLTSSGS